MPHAVGQPARGVDDACARRMGSINAMRAQRRTLRRRRERAAVRAPRAPRPRAPGRPPHRVYASEKRSEARARPQRGFGRSGTCLPLYQARSAP